MTIKEADTLNEQLKELEKLEMEKKQRQLGANPAASAAATSAQSNQSGMLNTAASLFSAKFPFGNKSSTTVGSSSNKSTTAAATAAAAATASSNLQDLLGLEADMLAKQTPSGNLQLFNDLLTNASDEFDREWQSAFSSSTSTTTTMSSTSQMPTTTTGWTTAPLSPTQNAAGDDFGFFVSAQDMMPTKQSAAAAAATSATDSLTDLTSLFPSRLLTDNNSTNSKKTLDESTKPLAANATATASAEAKSNKAIYFFSIFKYYFVVWQLFSHCCSLSLCRKPIGSICLPSSIRSRTQTP
jgi:hypothetical protein